MTGFERCIINAHIQSGIIEIIIEISAAIEGDLSFEDGCTHSQLL
jgi:hypothetical protein